MTTHSWTFLDDEIVGASFFLNLYSFPKSKAAIVNFLGLDYQKQIVPRVKDFSSLAKDNGSSRNVSKQTREVFELLSHLSNSSLIHKMDLLLKEEGLVEKTIPNYHKIYLSLLDLGGESDLPNLYKYFQSSFKFSVEIDTWQAVIRKDLQLYSSDSKVFKGESANDLFYNEDIGSGIWGVRSFKQINGSVPEINSKKYFEGKLTVKKHLMRERHPKLIRDAKKAFLEKNDELFCEACDFSFKSFYKDGIGDGFIEGHHTKQVSTMNDDHESKIEDIILLCSNCHSMIHRIDPMPSLDDFKKFLTRNKKA